MKRMTHDEWIQKHKDKFHKDIEILGKYISTRDKILVRCKLCNKEYETLPSVLISGCMCKNCSISKTHDEFVSEIKIINPNITILDKYKKDNIKINVKCNVCGHIWYAVPTHLIQKHGCPICANKHSGLLHRISQTDFENKLEKSNPSIECVGKYHGMERKILVKSKICGHFWNATPNNLIYGQSGCPICHMSHGERKIYLFLKNNLVNFVPQYTFDDLVGLNNGLLSYDFYLPDYNLLIEYQGQYHDGTAYEQTEREFLQQQEHDRRKKYYAKKHNINLLEIWYWDYNNIEQILNIKLNIDIKEVN